jgi:PAS domain S-box-containing protein
MKEERKMTGKLVNEPVRPGPTISELVANASPRVGQLPLESDARYQSIFEISPDAILETDLELRILFCNTQAAEMFSLGDRKEAIGMYFSQLITPESRQSTVDAMRQIPKNGSLRKFECTMNRGDDVRFPVEISSSLNLHGQDGHKSFIHIIHDVTERKRLEDELSQAAKMDTIGRLTAGVAHDFNNQLTTIIGRSNLVLKALKRDDPLRNQVEQILRAGERSASLTHQLLAFSRRSKVEPVILNLNSIVEDVEEMLRYLLGEDIEIKITLSDYLKAVKADPGQMEQIVVNLAANARDAMPNGGQLTIETANASLDEEFCHRHPGSRPGDYVMLAVKDTGFGMDDQVRSHIFEPFFSTKESGTGLGLSIVYGILKQHGGTIYCWSQLGRGTTFEVYIPQANEPLDVIPRRADTVAPKAEETILVVEDDREVLDIIAKGLNLYGYTVLEAENGDEALTVCSNYRGTIHLVLTDIMMPGMSGKELAARLKLGQPDLPILYMSGYTEDALIDQGVLQEDMEFIQKPFSPEVMADGVRHILDQQCSMEAGRKVE